MTDEPRPHADCDCTGVLRTLLDNSRCPYDGECGDFRGSCPYHAAEDFLRRGSGEDEE